MNRPVMQGTSDFTGSITSLYSSLLQTGLLRDSVGNVKPNGLFNSGYSTNTSLQNPVLHQVNYYDNYKFMTLEGFHTSMFPAATQPANGLLTGTVTVLLDGSGKKLYTVYYYDEKGRQSKVVSSNHLGGYDITTMTYTFTGKPATMKHVHAATGTTELYIYTYDSGDRLKSVTHKLDSHATVTIVNNTYDNLGRLQKNSRNGHGKLATSYGYNVRNWMTKNSSPLFSESITYGYGGNITGRTDNQNGVQSSWSYNYDQLSRLTGTSRSITSVSGYSYFGTSYSYDKHGNPMSIVRYGQLANGTYGMMDDLALSYNGNQTVYVKESSQTVNPEGSNDFRQGSTASTHYFYDKNGRLVKDLNKNITDISYNSLHLPSSITVDGATHTYVYAADGRKLRVVEGGVTRDYVGNLIYENGSLKRILFDGGYIEGGVYHFYLTDYLGNVSTVADATGNLVQQNRYYPFGLPTAETGNSEQDKQPYKYNGKELDRTNGLNWYDYGARMYDPALCRFLTMDPLAEKYYGISPYAYCLNNPTKLVDPNGKEGIRYTDRRDNKKIVEANIVVLLDKTEDIPEGVTQAQKEKIEKRNARIEKRNQRKLERVREDLNAAYNGSDGEGSPGSDGELVKFKFNVIGKPVSDTTGKGENLTRIAYENGLPAKGTPGRRAVATVITTGSTGGALGLHKGAQITISAAAPQYTISHEVGHSLKLNDSYGNGSSATSGIMFSPPTPVISSEVDEIWANALDKL